MKREELERLTANELIDLVLSLQNLQSWQQKHQGAADTPPEAATTNGNGEETTRTQTPQSAATVPLHESDAPDETDDSPPARHQIDEQLQRTSLLLQLSIEFRETLEPQVIVERMLHVMVSNLGISNASVVLIGLDGSVELGMSLHDGGMQDVTSLITRTVLDRGLAGWVLRHGRSVVLPDVSRDKRWIPYSDWQKTGSAIVLPIRQTQTTLGVLTIFHPQPNHFSSRDMLLMEGVAAHAGIALGASRRYQEENRRREQAMALLATSQFLTIERTFDDLADMLQERSQSIFGVDFGLLFLTTNTGLSPVALPAGLNHPRHRTLVKQATVVARKSVEQKNIVTDSDSPENPTQTFMALPMVHSGATIGTVVLIRTSGGNVSFSANVWSMLTTFTNVIATTCANMKLVEQFKRHTENLDNLIGERTRLVQRSRDLLRAIADNLPEGLILLDSQEVLLAANNSFCYNVIGRHPRQVVGENLPDIWEELEQRGELRIEPRHPSGLEVLPSVADSELMRVFCTNAHEQQCWFEISRMPVGSDDGDVEYYIERWLDVTHHEEVQRQVLMQDQRSILGSLATRVIHDIDTPLQNVVGCLNLCTEETDLSSKNREYLNLANEELARVGRTLENLRLLYQTPKTTWECVNINHVLNQVHHAITQQFEQRSIYVYLNLDQQLPPIYGQPDALRQVFMGIAFNACEAMPEGGDINMSSHWKKDEATERPFCHIIIRDSGSGMTEEQIATLFEPFKSNRSQGIGLGLYLIKQIIEQHSGHIEITSKKREGTVVEVSLPWNERCH